MTYRVLWGCYLIGTMSIFSECVRNWQHNSQFCNEVLLPVDRFGTALLLTPSFSLLSLTPTLVR